MIWFNTAVAIIGTILNAKQLRFGFILWMLTNGVFVVYNLYINSYQQAALFSVYFGLAVYAWISWGKGAKKVATETS
ncbi:hypothetical protein LCGC14_1682980 [marine sediment metagenome]|uniref:Nicotinamide mononucleotide transporter PnuC n=1 Tax=marine sediment metagenome TaxID=412755 RepID=A0A0F9HN64_9ZZZZ